MTITPALPTFSALGIQQAAGISALLAASTTQDAAGLGGGSAIVELSGLGQLLSAASTFQNTLTNLQPGSTTTGLGENFGTDFGSLAAEVQSFVDAFNTLQSNLAALQGPFGPLTGESLATRLSQALNSQATATIATGTAGPTGLAQIGVELSPASATAPGGTLTVNLQTLQSAFEANPTGTFSLLAQAAQSFGNIAASFTSQAGTQSATLGTLAQIEQSNLAGLLSLESLGGLNTFGGGLAGTGLSTLNELFALAALGPGDATTLTQQVTALNEFNLVSTLL